MDSTIFTFDSVVDKATDKVHFKAAIWFDSTNHGTKGIKVSCDHAVFAVIFTSDSDHNATFICADRSVAETFKLSNHVIHNVACVASR